MLLNDLFGFIRRNCKSWNKEEKQKAYYEAKKIVSLLEKELKIN